MNRSSNRARSCRQRVLPAKVSCRLATAAGKLVLVAMLGACSDNTTTELGQESVQPGELEIAREMAELIKEVSLKRSPDGSPVRRFNQAKSLGCFDATFTVSDNLPAKLGRGLFARPATYPAVVRFASASTDDDREKDLRGASVKIPRFADADLTDGETVTLDFLFNSYPALFVANPQDFLSFIKATASDRRWTFLLTHPASVLLLLKARDIPASPFDISYWSTTPYRYGADTNSAVKYSLKSCSTITTTAADNPGANHLSQAMQDHLRRAPACFDFMVQFQSHAELMPIEDASVIWDEDISPFTTVARITIEDQPFRDTSSMAECEAMSFNPWDTLSDHQPLGGINRVRKSVYDDLAEFRATQNARD